MPAHDWTRVDDGIFHDFHLGWIAELRKTLNGGLLPAGYYALGEQVASQLAYTERQWTLVIRHLSGHRVALIEIVSAGNKASAYALDGFIDKAIAALRQGIHLLILDLYPPGPRDPQGIHGVLWERLTGEAYERPEDLPLTLAAYSAGMVKTCYVEPVAVGTVLPEMPLFLDPERYVNVPLEATYQASYSGLPGFYRELLER